MKYLYTLIALSLAEELQSLNGTKCPCSQITQYSDCISQGVCYSQPNEQCTLVKYIPYCEQFQRSQKQCDRRKGCAWNNNSTCSDFTQCSDYTIDYNKIADQCYLKDSTCIPGYTTEKGQTTCTSGMVSCNNVKDPQICQILQLNQTSQCWWANKCITQDYSKCSTITDGFFCIIKNCVYKNSTCFAPSCSDIQVEDKCDYVRDDEYQKLKICVWKENKCENAVDTWHLNVSTCFIKTGGSFFWDIENNICSACSNVDGDDIKIIIILSVSIPLGVFFLLGILYYVRRKILQRKKHHNYSITGQIIYNDIEIEQMEKQRFCTICQASFQDNSEVKVTICKHIFHSDCYIQWTKSNNDCPLCRQIVK